MVKVMKNDGTWEARPSGLKQGNLNRWREMMFAARSEPEIDDIIIDKTTEGEIIGYLCTVADGYDSFWKRVAKPIVPSPRGGFQQQAPQQQGGFPSQSQKNIPSNMYFTKRAKEAFNVSE
jgi:hypothetical protein